MKLKRSSGILLHITSLPGEYGIGDLGISAYDFINFLHNAKQRYWQFLPTGPTNPGLDNSPYMSLSAFAGNPLLISPEILVETGLLQNKDLEDKPEFSKYLVEYEKVIEYKFSLLEKAFGVFQKNIQTDPKIKRFSKFCENENPWLDDYALFMSLGEKYDNKPWYEWPKPIAARNDNALAQSRRQLSHRISFHKFVQFCFYEQWNQLHNYATERGISLIGDIPFYVGLDSSDVWANQTCFKLNKKNSQPSHVAGVPPDYFSDTGQRWGNPVYRWKTGRTEDNKKLYSWWQYRFEYIFKTVEWIRIDHFRGFEASWQIPAHEDTAINGRWIKGPGKFFFKKIFKNNSHLTIIAEDLGIITRQVEKLRDDLNLPGMKILHFAFDSDELNPYLPHNFATANCVVYTGTHDNNTTVGWYLSEKLAETGRARVNRYANYHDGGQINWDLIRLSFSSIADLAITPLQDVLGFGEDCRMNTPSTCNGNWRWRIAPEFLTDDICNRLADETTFYRRAPAANEK